MHSFQLNLLSEIIVSHQKKITWTCIPSLAWAQYVVKSLFVMKTNKKEQNKT